MSCCEEYVRDGLHVEYGSKDDESHWEVGWCRQRTRFSVRLEMPSVGVRCHFHARCDSFKRASLRGTAAEVYEICRSLGSAAATVPDSVDEGQAPFSLQ